MDFCVKEPDRFFGRAVRRVVKFSKAHGPHITLSGVVIRLKESDLNPVTLTLTKSVKEAFEEHEERKAQIYAKHKTPYKKRRYKDYE